MTETLLPSVTPVTCQRDLSFTEWQRVVTQLMQRDRVLEQAVQAFTSEEELAQTSSLLKAFQLLMGPALVDVVVESGQLPTGVEDFGTMQRDFGDRLAALEQGSIITDPQGTPIAVKSVVSGITTSIQSFQGLLSTFQTQLNAIVAATGAITTVTTQLTTLTTRVTDLESLMADLQAEVTNARVEFASDPSKRLVDKISSMDSAIAAVQQQVAALSKEIVDARNAALYDTLAQRLGSMEASIEAFQQTLEKLQGSGTVSGLRAGRSVLNGQVELIPGSNIVITRERNGFRIDVADLGTVVDLAAPVVDPNACCGPNRPSFGG